MRYLVLAILLTGCTTMRESIQTQTTVSVKDTLLTVQVPSVSADLKLEPATLETVSDAPAVFVAEREGVKVKVDTKKRTVQVEVTPPPAKVPYKDTTAQVITTTSQVKEPGILEKFLDYLWVLLLVVVVVACGVFLLRLLGK